MPFGMVSRRAAPDEFSAELKEIMTRFEMGALNWPPLKGSSFEAICTFTLVLFRLVGSSLFAAVFAFRGGSQMIESCVLELNPSPTGFI